MEKKNYRDSDELLSQWKIEYEEPLDKALSKQLDPLFANPDGETWAKVKLVLASETESAVSKLLADISEFEFDPKESNKMVQDLRDYGRNVVERKAREEAGNVQQRMKVRFASILNAALVTRKVQRTTTKVACIECLKLLSVMVAIRLEEKPVTTDDSKLFSFCKEKLDKYKNKHSSSDTDKLQNKILGLSTDAMGKIEKKLISSRKKKQDKVIEKMLISSLMGKKSSSKNLLASSTWPEVSPEDTLITPEQCKVLWEYFQAGILHQTQAFTSGQAAGVQAHTAVLSLGHAAVAALRAVDGGGGGGGGGGCGGGGGGCS